MVEPIDLVEAMWDTSSASGDVPEGEMCLCGDVSDGDDLDEAALKHAAVQRARDLLARSCTLEEKLSDLAARHAFVMRGLRLPLLVRTMICDFLPAAEEDLWDQPLLGLHNGHDYVFKGMANLPAGRLCSRRSSLAGQSVDDTLDHHCSEFGCPVARGAPVAVVLRPGDEEEGFYATPLLLPTEFAVLVPTTAAPAPLGSEGSASPASPSPRSLECFEDLESWYDDFEMVCDSESEMVCEEEEDELDCEGEMSEMSYWNSSRWPCTLRKKPKGVQMQTVARHVALVLPQDSALRHAAQYASAHSDWKECGSLSQLEGVGVERVRALLCGGANPTIAVNGWPGRSLTALEEAQASMFSLKAHIDDLLGGKMCSHQARRQFHHYHFAESMAEVQKIAEGFLLDLARYEESIAVMKAAADLWQTAGPAQRSLCSRECLHGRKVVLPDLAEVEKRITAIPVAQRVAAEVAVPLAAAMWRVAEEEGSRMLDARMEGKGSRRLDLTMVLPVQKRAPNCLILVFWCFGCIGLTWVVCSSFPSTFTMRTLGLLSCWARRNFVATRRRVRQWSLKTSDRGMPSVRSRWPWTMKINDLCRWALS
ncbi:unnamed protein product [Durusdinium trenchii]|uniref:Uncharacterized protein n=1 Tax=Durusdinium trenchii TaxID=1381693 RepID=A0ABP0PND1_9DINO